MPRILKKVLPIGKTTGLVEAECHCGKIFVTKRYYIKTGHTKSCGCLRVAIGISRATHGDSRKNKRTVEYGIWAAMLRRVRNPHTADWKNYGGRGIKVCDRWKEYKNFLADMGRRPSSNHSIDRINIDGDYEPANCRWVLPIVQQNNRRSSWKCLRGHSKEPGKVCRICARKRQTDFRMRHPGYRQRYPDYKKQQA